MVELHQGGSGTNGVNLSIFRMLDNFFTLKIQSNKGKRPNKTILVSFRRYIYEKFLDDEKYVHYERAKLYLIPYWFFL